ncbi:hypothetical protein PVAP13_3KG399954 [Panicum virgatum]|uniref:CCHC-type domain-containing protein n=1 Tax=Panicum virgatum TaxID=38727 RepID=A0A8T0V0L3_PANVG|nr:hypothetical protein PVAP13_3KG399954 [Panicum virgatum]
MLAEKELQGRQQRPRSTFGTSSMPKTSTPSSSCTPSNPPPATRPASTPAKPTKKPNSATPAALSSGRTSSIKCHRCHGIGHMKKDCPSQRMYIAIDDGYISASDAEDDDDDDSSEAATDEDAIFGGAAMPNLRSIIVQHVLSTQPEPS